MTSETLHPNTDGSEGVINKHTFTAAGDKTENKWEVWDGYCKEFKADQYKLGIWTVLKALKFHQFEQE